MKDFRPTTLHKAIIRPEDMKDTINKKVPTKPFITQGGKEIKFPQKPWAGKDRTNEAIQREIRRNKLLFSCKDPWEPGHRCMGKGKVH